MDDNGTPKYVSERGTADDLKKDIAGSDKRYGFTLPPERADTQGSSMAAVFESPADLLAHHTIHDIGQTGWDGFRLSLGGTGPKALINFLEYHPCIKRISFCLDNDSPGIEAAKRIIDELLRDSRFSHLKINIAPPPIGTDYADTVKAMQEMNIQKATSRQHQAAF